MNKWVEAGQGRLGRLEKYIAEILENLFIIEYQIWKTRLKIHQGTARSTTLSRDLARCAAFRTAAMTTCPTKPMISSRARAALEKTFPSIFSTTWWVQTCFTEGYGNFFSEARLKPKTQHKLLIDRFVPNRLASNTELVLADTSGVDENTPEGFKKEDSENKTVTISEIYRKHILGVTSENPNDLAGSSYHNNNRLKFR